MSDAISDGPSNFLRANRPSPRIRTEALRTAARRSSLLAETRSNGALEPTATPAGKTIFVSYAHVNSRRVARFMAWLRQKGFNPVWDRDFHAGHDFDEAIREHIKCADAVVVVWSHQAAASRFVRHEAKLAFKLGKLVCVRVPDFDLDLLPMGLGHLHVVNIRDEGAVLRSIANQAMGVDDRAAGNVVTP